MTTSRRTRRTWLVIASIAGVLILALGAVLLAGRGGEPSPGTAAPEPTPPAPPGTAAPGTTAPIPGDTMTVTVFFHRGAADDPQRVVPVVRTVPRSAAAATAALGQLLAGPTDAERETGHFSQFGPATAGSLTSVRVANGVARADFRDFSTIIPNASSSFGSAALLAELDATLKQFPTVTSTVYSFEGDVRAFYEWLQLAPPGADGDAAAAAGAARRFLGHVVGMHRPAGGEFRSTGADVGEVVFWARSPHGTPLREIATVVSVRRDGGGWSATGSTTSTILVDTPAAGIQVTSPVALRGRSVAFEGTVSVRVLAERAGGATEIGRGFVTGGGDALGPFSGQVDVRPPDAAAGWVVFFEESAADGSVLRATTVPVLFASAAQ